jgi:predicted transcriptional regulator
MALVKALATASADDMSRSDYGLVGRALADLQRRGFDLAEVKAGLKRMREVNHGAQACEAPLAAFDNLM